MKKIICLLFVLFAYSHLQSQTSQAFKFQAVARDASGNVLANQDVSFRLSILQDSATGISVYTETHTAVSNEYGLVNLEIGNGTPVSGDFSAIAWGNNSHFIKIEMDETGGNNYQFMGTSQLLSVPYARHARTAEIVTGDSVEFTHYIGELYGGGIVVAVWKEADVEHGLIASLTDVSSGLVWSNMYSALIGPSAQSPIDGQANANAIIAQPGHTTSAAKLCDDYSSGGFSDWYLPAKWELTQCYNAAFVVNTILGATNGFQFTLAGYWSSTEYQPSQAWYQDFYNNEQYPRTYKYGTLRVRAVRRF